MRFAHEFVLEAARRLSARGTNVFTVHEIVQEAQALGAPQRESTLRTHVMSRCCVASPANHTPTYDYFDLVGRGRYRLAN